MQSSNHALIAPIWHASIAYPVRVYNVEHALHFFDRATTASEALDGIHVAEDDPTWGHDLAALLHEESKSKTARYQRRDQSTADGVYSSLASAANGPRIPPTPHASGNGHLLGRTFTRVRTWEEGIAKMALPPPPQRQRQSKRAPRSTGGSAASSRTRSKAPH